MNATLTYDLNNVDDRIEHSRAINAMKMASVLFEINYNLHKKCLWEAEELKNTTATDGIDLVFSKIYNLLQDENLNMEDLS